MTQRNGLQKSGYRNKTTDIQVSQKTQPLYSHSYDKEGA